MSLFQSPPRTDVVATRGTSAALPPAAKPAAPQNTSYFDRYTFILTVPVFTALKLGIGVGDRPNTRLTPAMIRTALSPDLITRLYASAALRVTNDTEGKVERIERQAVTHISEALDSLSAERQRLKHVEGRIARGLADFLNDPRQTDFIVRKECGLLAWGSFSFQELSAATMRMILTEKDLKIDGDFSVMFTKSGDGKLTVTSKGDRPVYYCSGDLQSILAGDDRGFHSVIPGDYLAVSVQTDFRHPQAMRNCLCIRIPEGPAATSCH